MWPSELMCRFVADRGEGQSYLFILQSSMGPRVWPASSAHHSVNVAANYKLENIIGYKFKNFIKILINFNRQISSTNIFTIF